MLASSTNMMFSIFFIALIAYVARAEPVSTSTELTNNGTFLSYSIEMRNIPKEKTENCTDETAINVPKEKAQIDIPKDEKVRQERQLITPPKSFKRKHQIKISRRRNERRFGGPSRRYSQQSYAIVRGYPIQNFRRPVRYSNIVRRQLPTAVPVNLQGYYVNVGGQPYRAMSTGNVKNKRTTPKRKPKPTQSPPKRKRFMPAGVAF